MKVASHVGKVRRMAALRQRLDPLADFEMWYWTTLTAGTNMLNATLHLAGLTRDDPVFSTIPGVHLVRQPDGTYARELRGLGTSAMSAGRRSKATCRRPSANSNTRCTASSSIATPACAAIACPPRPSSTNASRLSPT